jgi:hypothetical protein
MWKAVLVIIIAVAAFVCIGLGFAKAQDCQAAHGRMAQGTCVK